MSALVTVVVPTRDRLPLLRTTVASVLGQVGVSVEVVVVDDGGREPVTEQLLGGDPRVRVLRNDASTGVSRARNRGIEHSRSRWTACLDDDDLWAPDKLRRQLAALSTAGGSRWAMSGAAHVTGDGAVLRVLQPPPSGDVLERLLRSNCVPGGGSGVLVETALLQEVGGFSPDLAVLADWDCWLRLAERSPAAAVDRPDVGYRQHLGSMAQDLTRSRAELDELARRHAGATARTGSAPDAVAWQAHLERMAYRGGDARQGRLLSRELVLRHRRWRSAARPLLGLLPPRTTDRLSALATRWTDRELHAEAAQWIGRQLALGQP